MNEQISITLNNSYYMYLFISFPGGTKKCMDLDNNCDNYVTDVDKRQCQRQPDYMMQNCKRACDFCGPGRNECVILIYYGHHHIKCLCHFVVKSHSSLMTLTKHNHTALELIYMILTLR